MVSAGDSGVGVETTNLAPLLQAPVSRSLRARTLKVRVTPTGSASATRRDVPRRPLKDRSRSLPS